MSKLAVIKTGGKQYLVQEGSKFQVEKLSADGSNIKFTETLLVADTDGTKVDIGAPHTKTAVAAEILKQGRARKIEVVHYKPKVRYHKKYGHRQPFTEVKVTSIN